MNQTCRVALAFILAMLVSGVQAGERFIPAGKPVSNEWVSLAAPPFLGRIACSGDGRSVLAVSRYGTVYHSRNEGRAWTMVKAFGSAMDVALSYNGQKLIVVTADGLYQSRNGGLTWRKNPMSGVEGQIMGWSRVRCSADGNTIVASSGSRMAISTDAGISWINGFPVGAGAVDVSADGKTIVALAYGFIYVSHDSGATWEDQAVMPPTTWFPDVTISGDGQTIIVLRAPFSESLNSSPVPGLSDGVYTSVDFGATWQPKFLPGVFWSRVVCSADASTLVAIPVYFFLTPFFMSRDGGESWQPQTQLVNGWLDAACSADGKVVYALDLSGLYVNRSK